MTLGCRSFLREFLAEFENDKSKTNWEKIWNKNNIWNGKMLGTGKSRENNDYGLLGRIGQKNKYEVQAEWMRFDQTWYYLCYPGESWIEQPWKIDVIIEHENNFQRFEYTLFKFEGASAPLKVGIFYPDEEVEYEVLVRASQIIQKQVIAYPGGVYLLIFGFLDDEKGICWRAYEIDFKGNIIPLCKNTLVREENTSFISM